jgi:hypothetical protein
MAQVWPQPVTPAPTAAGGATAPAAPQRAHPRELGVELDPAARRDEHPERLAGQRGRCPAEQAGGGGVGVADQAAVVGEQAGVRGALHALLGALAARTANTGWPPGYRFTQTW